MIKNGRQFRVLRGSSSVFCIAIPRARPSACLFSDKTIRSSLAERRARAEGKVSRACTSGKSSGKNDKNEVPPPEIFSNRIPRGHDSSRVFLRISVKCRSNYTNGTVIAY